MKKIGKGVLFALILLLLMAGAGYLVRPVQTDEILNNAKAFHSLPDDSVQVMIYGTSRPWRGLDPLQMYQEYGIGAYNYAANWQHINTTLLYMKDSIRTQKPDVVLLETRGLGRLLKARDLNSEIYYTRGIPLSAEKLRYICQVCGRNPDRYFAYLFPVYAFHENWEAIGETLREKVHDAAYYVSHMGKDRAGDHAYVADLAAGMQAEQGDLREDARDMLEEIADTCSRIGAQLVLFTIPSETGDNYMEAIDAFARERGITYVNGFDNLEELGLDPETDFGDKLHLNESGSRKVTAWMGRYLDSHFELEDFRNVPGNLWEQGMAALGI